MSAEQQGDPAGLRKDAPPPGPDATSNARNSTDPRPAAPSWIRELDMALTVHPQVLLTGNVRDQYLLPDDHAAGSSATLAPYSLGGVIESLCAARGYGALAFLDQVHERITLLRLSATVEQVPPVLREFAERDEKWRRGRDGQGTDGADDEDEPEMLDRLRDAMVGVVHHPGPPIGLVVPYSGRLGSPQAPVAGEAARLFAAAEELGHTARPVQGASAVTPYNTVFWVVERQEELPREFAVGSRAVRVISVPQPPHDQRLAAARHVVGGLARYQAATGGPILTEAETATAAKALADSSHGMGSSEVMAIGRMALDRNLPVQRLDEAARLYRIGVLDNPWATAELRERIATGEEFLNGKVIGQPYAVRRTLEIFMRSAAGLNGAQASSSPSRPRGTLFLSGPTGVGKTELAKGVAEMILGKDARPIRFDMSEFAEEHARDRLIGAPPGFVGHDAGGELTNAVRANPMSVLLFDEIDKANPRLFDLFLQILEDGRLTDGRGATVYFTECVLVFTSNLGITAAGTGEPPKDGAGTGDAGASTTGGTGGGTGEAGGTGATEAAPRTTRGQLSRHDDPTEVRHRLRQAFDIFFNDVIKRPELRNRFGDNFIPMDFMQEKWVPRILDKAIASVAGRVLETHGAELVLADDAWEVLRVEATRRLDHGGRGVLTAVESALVNPLAKEVFRTPPRRGERLRVVAIEGDGDGEVYRLEVERWQG
ncbi:AAA family ATPase [Kitasatospora purpeofusca]|uniref:AAA family ATPase n=1 Tax=Kitasatospora purpeofusca TaxID=67352 RepID=UPI002258BECA|nr:AAA family ATPase [Kitasatospora purpeofusca]MCX4758949.1 AAA family ATPase [Kitasatospora purpeofusca]WSR30629.1 AAA family ATPase [Kitasatospora purpeofusca]WSR38867.1 AAA family ATPase [Kitasatospora purpeofusca]